MARALRGQAAREPALVGGPPRGGRADGELPEEELRGGGPGGGGGGGEGAAERGGGGEVQGLEAGVRGLGGEDDEAEERDADRGRGWVVGGRGGGGGGGGRVAVEPLDEVAFEVAGYLLEVDWVAGDGGGSAGGIDGGGGGSRGFVSVPIVELGDVGGEGADELDEVRVEGEVVAQAAELWVARGTVVRGGEVLAGVFVGVVPRNVGGIEGGYGVGGTVPVGVVSASTYLRGRASHTASCSSGGSCWTRVL